MVKPSLKLFSIKYHAVCNFLFATIMYFVTWLMQISIYYLLGSGIVDILKKPRLAKTTPSFVNKVSAQNKTLFCIVFSLDTRASNKGQ